MYIYIYIYIYIRYNYNYVYIYICIYTYTHKKTYRQIPKHIFLGPLPPPLGQVETSIRIVGPTNQDRLYYNTL